MLWLLEDFAGGSKLEVETLLEHSIHTRVTHILKQVVSSLRMLNPINNPMDINSIKYCHTLICQIFTILSNISSDHKGGRTEIIKQNVFQVVSEIMDFDLIIQNQECFEYDLIDIMGWFLINLTQKLEERFLTKIADCQLIPKLTRLMLYSGSCDTVADTLDIFVNLSNVYSELGPDMFI